MSRFDTPHRATPREIVSGQRLCDSKAQARLLRLSVPMRYILRNNSLNTSPQFPSGPKRVYRRQH